MKCIVAVDNKWAIGCNGELLFRIPDDLKFFRQKTLNKVVVMGRETFLSLPNQQPLKDRTNIVLSRTAAFADKSVLICRSLDELFELSKNYNSDDVFIIGGEQIYKQLIYYCDEVFVTKIDSSAVADKYFIDLDNDARFKLSQESGTRTCNGINYRFVTYERC